MKRSGPVDKQIGLALSGGGFRAMAFHAGVLRWLAETELISQIVHISSVSGGSLLIGLIFRLAGWQWPNSQQYINSVLPEARKILTEKDLLFKSVLCLANPINWRHILARANILAKIIGVTWDIKARIGDLPEVPIWSVNATTAETGRRFRFKRTAIGEYELGYADAATFKVADTMAISAAFPGLIGPFMIRTADYAWYKRESWNAEIDSAELKLPPFKRIHLYDGGVYDNLGTEPLFDSGKQELKNGVNFILVSDAGKALSRKELGFSLNPLRLKRVADIFSDQARALRVRSFITFLQAYPTRGLYIQIGSNAPQKLEIYKHQNPVVADNMLNEEWLCQLDVLKAAGYKTSISRMRKADFDLLERHGYETAKWNGSFFAGI